jgi:hypothetical protein
MISDGESDVKGGQNEHFAPADAGTHPAPEEAAKDRPDACRNQDQPRLPIGQLPFLEYKRQHIADQKEVKEIKHIADIRGSDDLPLVRGQLLLTFQVL